MSSFAMPPYPAGTLQQQVMQQYSYLFQMSQQLNMALSQLQKAEQEGVAGGNTTAMKKSAGKDNTQQQYQTLKSMIIKTSDQVGQSMEQLSTQMSGEYVAISDFGNYMEKLNAYIEANPEAITQYYSFYADLQADVNKVNTAFSNYKAGTEGYIRTGIVYYDGVLPVYGVAVGQNLTTTEVDGEEVVDQKNFRATFTAKNCRSGRIVRKSPMCQITNYTSPISWCRIPCNWADGIWRQKTAWLFSGSEGKRWHITILQISLGAPVPILPDRLPMITNAAAPICSIR